MHIVVTIVLKMYSARNALLVASVLAGCSLSGPKDATSLVEVASGESLVEVRDRVRALPVEARARGGEVVIPPGEYFLPAGMEFTEVDGGVSTSARVVWRAKKPGQVRIVGSRRVASTEFRRLSDPRLLARLPEESRGKVFFADISSISPGRIPQLANSFTGTPVPPMVFMGEEFGVLAKWPNGGEWTSFTKRVDRGSQGLEPQFSKMYSNGAFVYSNPRAKRWNFAEGVWLNGYWTHDWFNNSIKVGSYGQENGTNDVVRLDGSMMYGVMGGTWGRKERRFRAINLFDELDEPGEWFIDRAKKVLYVIPHGGGMEGEDVRIGYSANALVRGCNVRNLRFDGIEFAFNFGTLASFRESDGVEFVDCRFVATAKNGLELDGLRNAVRRCEVFNCGAQGVSISGGDRASLTRSDSIVENCRIHRFGVFQRTYAPGCKVQGCGMTLRGNELWDAPHAAVTYGGNEMLFEYNDVHHVLMETGDAGAFYTGRDWTTQGNVLRYNFVHELGTYGGHASTMGFYFDDCDCGDAVYGNVFWKVARGIMIGGGREHPVRNNIFAECRIGLSIDSRGMTWKEWNTPSNGWDLEAKAKKMRYTDEPWKSRYPLLAKIMEDSPREPLYNPVEDNLFLNCTEKLLALDKKMDAVLPKMKFGGNVAFCTPPFAKCAAPDVRIANAFDVRPCGEDPGFADASHGDFRLKEGARAAELIPALKHLPLARICRMK